MRATCGLRTSRFTGACCAMLLSAMVPGGWGQDLSEGTGKEIVKSICSQCHGLNYVTSSKKTKKGWQSTVNSMVGAEGAPLTEDEIAVVVQYLTTQFGNVINVNKATSKELEAGLSLTAKEAEEIIRYREQNGDFRTWEDLRKVPDLDAKKLEAMKDRVAF